MSTSVVLKVFRIFRLNNSYYIENKKEEMSPVDVTLLTYYIFYYFDLIHSCVAYTRMGSK